jgi:hypothetical protein
MMANWWKPGRARERSTEQEPDSQPTSLKAFYVQRVYRLVLIDARPTLRSDERWLVRRALDTTYQDCVAAGVQTQARAMLGLPNR